MKNARAGFTLIELLVVIVILGILATLSFGSFKRYFGSGNDSTRYAVVRALDLEMKASALTSTSAPYTNVDATKIQDMLNANDVSFTPRNEICVLIGVGEGTDATAALDNQFFVATWGEQDSSSTPGTAGTIAVGTNEATSGASGIINTTMTQAGFTCSTATAPSVTGLGSGAAYFMLEAGNTVRAL